MILFDDDLHNIQEAAAGIAVRNIKRYVRRNI